MALLQGKGEHQITVTKVARHLGIDKSSASRRVKAAIKLDYLSNLAAEGRPACLVKGEELPEEHLVLPTPSQVSGCSVARETAGEAPSPLSPRHR